MITVELLDSIEVDKADYEFMAHEVSDFYALSERLRLCSGPRECLVLLKAELQGRCRSSYIHRIYGKYRKTLPPHDYEEYMKWVKLNRRSKATSMNE